MFTIIFFSTFIISAVICHFMARQRHAKPVFWGVMGLLLGPLAILLLAYLSQKVVNNYKV